MLKKTGQLLKKYYPLTLPNVKPETKYRANEINNITTGILTKIAAAAYSPHCVDKLDWNDFNPNGNVYSWVSCKTIAATTYSLQLDIKLNNAVITIAGVERGIIIL